MPGYYSVYSFPRGHSTERNIPKVDCIFIDLDVDGSNYDPKSGNTDLAAWKRDMSALLARARMIAQAILDADEQDHFRVTLSGHKGLHIYLDFPTIAPGNGDFQQFKNGLKSYGENVMEWLDTTAGGINIDPWVDVDASDLGRLARHPNTIHHGAAYDDETRWCVPITVEELTEVHVEDYLELTQEPRWSEQFERTPSESAGDKAIQEVRNAHSGPTTTSRNSSSVRTDKLIQYYDHELDDKWYNDTDELTDGQQAMIADVKPANEDIELDDIPFITSNKPCITEFRDRDDAFDYANASHTMEINIISRFVEMGVPRDVIHTFFSTIDGYREDYTDEQINKIISREYSEFNCGSITRKAATFCLGESCDVYRRNDDIQK